MLDITDPIQYRVTHVEVARSQIDFGTQRIFSLGKFAVLHTFEQIQAFFDGTVSPGTLGRDIDIAAVFAELFRSELTDIGQTLLDQFYGKLVILLEIVGAVKHAVTPVETEPVNIILNGFYIFGIFLGRIGIIHTQIGNAAEFLGNAKVDAKGLAVSDMKISVWFRREAGMDLHSFVLTAGADVLFYECFNKVFGVFDFFHKKPCR